MNKKKKKRGSWLNHIPTRIKPAVRGPEPLFCCVCKEPPFYQDTSGSWYCSQDWYKLQKAKQIGSVPVAEPVANLKSESSEALTTPQ